jgi:hypothetical protein
LYDDVMRRPELHPRLRLTVAETAGAVSRLALTDAPLADRLVELREITTDPRVLGDVLGCWLGGEPRQGNDEAVTLLRAAGADEQVAAAVAEWQRWRIADRGQGPGLGH